jgi:chromosome segregation ATPase
VAYPRKRLEKLRAAEDGKASDESASGEACAQIAEESGGQAVSTDERVAQLESAFVTLTQLVQSHGERFDTHMTWINRLGEAQADSEQKIAALVDAQIRTEDELRKLAEQGAQANARLDRLAQMVERLMEGRNGQG